MKKNIDYSFAMGYIYGLSAKLLTKQKLEKLKNSKTIEEFLSLLKKEKYPVKGTIKYEEFESIIEKNFWDILKELQNFCNYAEEFEYIFCKSNFLNFKICLNQHFCNKKTRNFKIILSNMSQEEIKECIKSKEFSSLKQPYNKAFKNCFDVFLELQNKKQIDIKIDQEMYKTLLNLAKNNKFLTRRTKLEITLKNINFLVRTLNSKKNITEKELDLCLIENGVLDIKNEIDLKTQNIKNLLLLYKKLTIANINLNLNENTETIEENILNKFDKSYLFETFNFTPIFNFINSFKKEIEILKETMLKLSLKMKEVLL